MSLPANQDHTESGEIVELPVLPLRNTVIFPFQIAPLSVGRPKSLQLVREASTFDNRIGLVAQRDGAQDEPSENDLHQWGTVASIIKVLKMPDGSRSVMVQGTQRFKVLGYTQREPYYVAQVELMPEEDAHGVDIDAIVVNLQAVFAKVAELAPYLTADHAVFISNLNAPSQLADSIAAHLNLSVEEKQEVIETLNMRTRLERVLRLVNKEFQILELGSKIQSEVQGEINKTQREYYLREQLKAIRRELGEDEDDRTTEINELRGRIEEAGMSEEVRKVAEKELDRLSKMPPAAAEYTVARTYLDWLIEIPWDKSTEDNLDVSAAEKVLNEDHYDLDKVKKRILEYMAVRQLKDDMKGPILCFVGPPGVGKTSLGRSIARAMGREFLRISLGGMHDEAEIRGHRRTYIGALPGRIVQGLKKAGTNNPVFMLDEIDKVGADFRGDPSSALLEVLDPEQNFSFSDHYLEVPVDLSKVIFIATANIADTIQPALRDRMEVLELPGYTEADKVKIAQRFLIPKQTSEHGLTSDQIKISEKAIRQVIGTYTREAGVRNLERNIASICRGVAREVVEGKVMDTKTVKEGDLHEYLGPEKFYQEVAERTSRPGVSTGLAWTPAGGDILFVEATQMRGKGGINMTGQLGDVMKESGQTAISYVRSRTKALEIDDEFFEKSDLHIHVPAGAIPKDGPSAGVTIYTALVSLLTDRKVRNDVAMTGEITLRGLVLPVGGIKEKVLAAKRAGIKKVILPEKNRKDLEDVPEQVREELDFVFVKEMDEVVREALCASEGEG